MTSSTVRGLASVGGRRGAGTHPRPPALDGTVWWPTVGAVWWPKTKVRRLVTLRRLVAQPWVPSGGPKLKCTVGLPKTKVRRLVAQK
jgi:hypothetical protein